jgi:hypothetical protein
MEDLRTYTLTNHKRAVLPKNWAFEKTSKGFVASCPSNGSKITGWIVPNTTYSEKFDLDTYLSNFQLTKQGIITKQNISIHTWEMQSMQTAEGSILTVFSQLQSESQIHLVLESNAIDHTKNIKDVIIPLLASIMVNSI